MDVYPVFTEPRAGSREGIWWQPREGVKDVLIFGNSLDRPESGTLSLFDSAGKRWSEPLALGPHQMVRMSVSDLIHTAGLTGSYGGMKLEVATDAGAIDSVHILYDETAGFSAMLKMFDRDPTAKLENRTWAGNTQWTMWAPMLALASPDAAVGFPSGTALRPKIFVYNPTGKSLTAKLSLSWRGASGQGRVALSVLQLLPHATQLLDIGPMQKKLGIPDDAHWALATLTTPAGPDSIVAVAASYDSTLRYGAQTPFSDQLSHQWMGGEWQVDATHNTISAIGNGGTRPAEALVTLHYNNGADKYEIRKTIAPGDELWLNLGDIIRNTVPDSKGRTLPASLQSGTYDIVDLAPTHEGTLFEGKVILDKTYGNLAYGCVNCCVYDFVNMVADPTNMAPTQNQPIDVYGENSCTGHQDKLNGDFTGTWWSDASWIAQVTPYQAQGVAPGSTFAHAYGNLPYQGKYNCPKAQVRASGTLNVYPTVTISGSTSIPMLNPPAQGTDSVTLTAVPNPSGGTYQWSVVSGQGNVTLLNNTSQSAIVQSKAVGTYTVQVIYTYNGMQATAATAGKVQQPGSLGSFSDTGSTLNNNCRNFPPDYPPYTGAQRQIVYDVLDTNGQIIAASGMFAQESFTPISNSCTHVSNVPSATHTTTFSNGNFAGPDILAMCSISCLPADQNDHPLGSCDLSVYQTWNVNGYAVQTRRVDYHCATVTLQ